MTTETLVESSGETPAADARLTALLRGAHARLRLTRMARGLTIAAPLALAALALLGWARVADVVSLAAAAAAAVSVTAVVTAVRTPSVPGVAALLDRRLQLADRVSTAVRVMPRADAVARFIVRDASVRLTPQDISSALPFEPHPWASAALAVSVACLALWAMPGGRTGETGGGGPSSGGGASRQAPDSQAGARGTSNGAASQDGGSAGRAGQPRAQVPAGAATDASGGREPRRANADSADGRREAEAAKLDERGTASGQTGGEAAAAGAGTRAEAPGPASVARGRGAQRGAPGSTPVPAPGGASVAVGPIREGAGGVGRGGLAGNADSRGTARSTPRARGVSAAALARARDVAEAAIAHDDVPPRHRAYVREHYRAVSRLNEP